MAAAAVGSGNIRVSLYMAIRLCPYLQQPICTLIEPQAVAKTANIQNHNPCSAELPPAGYPFFKDYACIYSRAQKQTRDAIFNFAEGASHCITVFIINKGGQVIKPIIVVKICYMLYVIQVVKKIFDK